MFVVLEHPYILYLNLLAKSPFLGKGFYFIKFYQIKNADVTIGGCSLAEEPFGMSVILGSICGSDKKVLMYCRVTTSASFHFAFHYS